MPDQPPSQGRPPAQGQQGPPRSQPPPRQQARNASQQQRASEQRANAKTPDVPETLSVGEQRTETRAGKSSGFKLGQQKATAGRAGERNLAIEWIDVWVQWAKPMRFNVRTAGSNPLEVLVEQLAYNRTYTGNGTVSTQVVPVVPIGTRGKLTARDTVTGETLEQPWVWINLGGAGAGGSWSLWAALKRLVWPSR